MKAIGIDFGSKRLGIAFGDSEIGIAFPRAVVENSPDFKRYLTNMIRKEDVGRVIVGLPLMMDGDEGRLSGLARAFADQLEDDLLRQGIDIPVDFFDERLTSRLARSAAKSIGMSERAFRGHTDASAAAIILQSFFDQQNAR